MGNERAESVDTAGFVRSFESLDRGSLGVAGGKAMNLGELTRASFPVPAGFCVTTRAYAQAARGSGIEVILEAITKAPKDELVGDRLSDLAGRARAAILNAPVPAEIEGEVIAAYRALGGGLSPEVAVRSSATAEDLPGASFAGQQDTYLNVVGEGALIEALRRCWASLWTDRAVAYRTNNRIDHRGVELAVVVQRMVKASVAGVLFTANPVTGRRREAVIDASPGLGEAVVSGAVNPDHFEVQTETGEILVRRLGDKRLVIEAAPGGGTRRVTREDASAHFCVTDDEAREIARLGARVEAHYGAPQDIEWAIDEERSLRLLQARPITTLYPLPEGAADGDLHVYFNANVAQGVFQPLTPMGVQCMQLLAAGGAEKIGLPLADPESGPRSLVEAAHRLHIDIAGILRDPIGRSLVSFAFARMEARSAAAVKKIEDDPRLAVDRAALPRTALMFMGIMARTRIPLMAALSLASPSKARDRVAAAALEGKAAGAVPRGAGAKEKLSAVERLLRGTPGRVLPTMLPTFAAGFLAFMASKRLLVGLSTSVENDVVLRALPHNPTTEMDLELFALSERFRGDEEASRLLRGVAPSELSARYRRGDLPTSVLAPLREFLDRYGHRGVAEIDVGVARWGEDPTHIFGSLANYLALDGGAIGPAAQFQRGEEEAAAMVEELARRAGAKSGIRGALVRFGLTRTRELAGVREVPKFHFVEVLYRARGLLLEIADELCAAGRLAARDDIFMLRLNEVRRAIGGEDARAIARERRASYTLEMSRKKLPRVYLSDGTEPETIGRSNAPNMEGNLIGTPASAGRVTARARVIMDPVGAVLLPGEVLVAPSTDPGWTPLFLTAAGLVMEMGGAMSHGSVVARECGIPAVVGVEHATTRIKTGDLLIVDGASGVVEIAGGEAAAGAGEEVVQGSARPTASTRG